MPTETPVSNYVRQALDTMRAGRIGYIGWCEWVCVCGKRVRHNGDGEPPPCRCGGGWKYSHPANLFSGSLLK